MPWPSSRVRLPSCETETMRVLVAMSGGVDSSVAAALLAERLGGDRVVGATLKLWGGTSDSGCCSVADVEDARRVADQLGVVHRVFNFGAEFEERVVEPYVRGHAEGRTPNPCIECNRHIKFDRLFERARTLGFDAVATGHHARCVPTPEGRYRLLRGADPLKDQSYVLAMLGQEQLGRALFPVGEMTKVQVRQEAVRLGLRTAAKPDSQDVCFIRSDEGRQGFLGDRLELHPGRLIDHDTGDDLGEVDAVELVTVGQRRGMGHGSDGRRRFVTAVDVPARRVSVGTPEAAHADEVRLHTVTWVDGDPTRSSSNGADGPAPIQAVVQCSAHGRPVPATVQLSGPNLTVRFATPQRRIAPGQTVALYHPHRSDEVIGSGICQ
jgi:tRNA-specific 2-thiouridylase